MTKIDNQDEIQFRQINPSWIEDDLPSLQAFIPTTKDKGKLSLARSATTNAESSFNDFKALGLKSNAVYGMTIAEFSNNPHLVECFDDPLENNPHHSYADFNDLTKSQKRAKCRELRRKAIQRGKLHP